jgi:replication factor A1
MIRENKVYLFANGLVKLANKKFTSIKNDYCLTFDQNADVAEAEEDNQIKK